MLPKTLLWHTLCHDLNTHQFLASVKTSWCIIFVKCFKMCKKALTLCSIIAYIITLLFLDWLDVCPQILRKCPFMAIYTQHFSESMCSQVQRREFDRHRQKHYLLSDCVLQVYNIMLMPTLLMKFLLVCSKHYITCVQSHPGKCSATTKQLTGSAVPTEVWAPQNCFYNHNQLA